MRRGFAASTIAAPLLPAISVRNPRRAGRRARPGQPGQSLVMAAFTLFAVVMMALMVLGIERTASLRIRLQLAADTAALSTAQVQANALAQIAWINEGMASIYYDLMRACVDTAATAVLAEAAEGKGLLAWDPSRVPGLAADADLAMPAALLGMPPGEAIALWEDTYQKASQRVPRAEKWLRRLGQLQRGIALLAPELMRHQMMYAARRNLAPDANSPAEIMDRVRVASYPDLNRTGFYEGDIESQGLTFISDADARLHRARIRRHGGAGLATGWEIDACETNNFYMNIRQERVTGARDAWPHWVGGGARPRSGEDWVVLRGDCGADMQQAVVKVRYADQPGDRFDVAMADHFEVSLGSLASDDPPSYQFATHQVIGEPALRRYRRMEQFMLYRLPGGASGGDPFWFVIENYTYDETASGVWGGMFNPGDREMLLWEGDRGNPSSGGPPTQRVRARADGGYDLWDGAADGYIRPPDTFTLSNLGGIMVPAILADRFHVRGGVVSWSLPININVGGVYLELRAPLNLSFRTPVGCHGYAHCLPSGAFRIHGLDTGRPDIRWSAAHNDRRRHRLFADEAAADTWWYEWIDAGPLLQNMDPRRFGYHALLDRLHPGVDHLFPRPDDDQDAGWEALLSEPPQWPRRAMAGTGGNPHMPAEPPRLPLWALLPQPSDPDAPDGDAPQEASPERRFGGWFDIRAGRPHQIATTAGVPGFGNSPVPVAYSRTYPCWFCGMRGDVPGPLPDLNEATGSPPWQRGRLLADGVFSGCGFWHEIFPDAESFLARLAELAQANADLTIHFPENQRRSDIPHDYVIQARCPFECRREWSDGSRPARLSAFGQWAGAPEREIPSHVRVTLLDAATRSFLHPLNRSRTVTVQNRPNLPARENRPRRGLRAPDYGYRHDFPETHWVRDYFGVYRNLRRDHRNDQGALIHSIAVISGGPNETDVDELTDFWDSAARPLEAHSLTGELFRGGITILVWSYLDDWMSRLWGGGGPARSSDAGEAYRERVRRQLAADEANPGVRHIPAGATARERDWAMGQTNPLEEAPWQGIFAMASARIFYPDGIRRPAGSDLAPTARYAFPWDGARTSDLDLLDQVVNPRRDRWLDSPANLFDPDWRAGLVPIGAALDLRDLESGEMMGATDTQYFLEHRLTRSPFRHSAAASQNAAVDNDSAPAVRRTRDLFYNQLLAPPGQRGRERDRVDWNEQSTGNDGIEQAIAH